MLMDFLTGMFHPIPHSKILKNNTFHHISQSLPALWKRKPSKLTEINEYRNYFYSMFNCIRPVYTSLYQPRADTFFLNLLFFLLLPHLFSKVNTHHSSTQNMLPNSSFAHYLHCPLKLLQSLWEQCYFFVVTIVANVLLLFFILYILCSHCILVNFRFLCLWIFPKN